MAGNEIGAWFEFGECGTGGHVCSHPFTKAS
jgi:hypothetical protein